MYFLRPAVPLAVTLGAFLAVWAIGVVLSIVAMCKGEESWHAAAAVAVAIVSSLTMLVAVAKLSESPGWRGFGV